MDTMDGILRLNQLCERFEALIRPLHISDYNTPVNRAEEKSRLLRGLSESQEYNPQFTFQDPPGEWTKPLTDFLRELDPSRNIWEHHLYQETRRLILELEAIIHHDPDKITAETIHTHGLPTPELIVEAERILQAVASDNEARDISAESAAQTLRDGLKRVGLSDWEIELKTSMNARMMVRSSEKKVFVRSDAWFSHASVQRLLVHEIGTHVFRYINGERQPMKIFRLGLIGYLGTEEGLAAYHEGVYGVQDHAALRRYALRVLGSSLCLTKGFYEIFLHLMQYTDDLDDLFEIVTRIKRGFKDTKHVGGHLKDIVYLKGYIDVSRHLSVYPNDYKILMSGKVSLAMLQDLKSLKHDQQLIEPALLPASLFESEDNSEN